MQLALADLCPPETGPAPLLELVYHGDPEIKKNRQQIITTTKRPLLVPPAAYRKAEKRAVKEICNALLMRPQEADIPVDRNGRELHVRALFFLGPRQRPDLDGLITACADILEAAGVIENDYRIVSWDGSRRYRDGDNPRTEVAIWGVC